MRADDHAHRGARSSPTSSQNGLIDPRVARADLPVRSADAQLRAAQRTSRSATGSERRARASIAPILLAPHSSFLGNHAFTVGSCTGSAARPRCSRSRRPAAPGSLDGAIRSGSTPVPRRDLLLLAGLGTVGAAGAGYYSLVTDIGYDPAIGGATAYIQAAVADAAGARRSRGHGRTPGHAHRPRTVMRRSFAGMPESLERCRIPDRVGMMTLAVDRPTRALASARECPPPSLRRSHFSRAILNAGEARNDSPHRHGS